jgi:site-specific DNA-methyltransferase (adenine-specific)
MTTIFYNFNSKSLSNNSFNTISIGKGKLINGDCIEVMKTLPQESVDLLVCSPPYNVNIKYDFCDDALMMNDYWNWTELWMKEAFRLLKKDGRVAINIPYEINSKERGGRVLFLAEFYYLFRKIGLNFFGLIDLNETSPHRSKTTAWGSWMSCSQPYIYNPKECVLLGYKEFPKKFNKGKGQWEIESIETNSINKKTKKIYSEEDKREFMELVYGQWGYCADTRPLTIATYSDDIPSKAIKILTYKGDVVLDCFSGSGTTAICADNLERNWIGIELSPNYFDISVDRIKRNLIQDSMRDCQTIKEAS